VVDLGGGGRSAAEDAGDDHEAISSDFAGVGGVGSGDGGVLSAGADDGGDACFDEAADPFHALVVAEERPVAHGATVNDSAHAFSHEALGSFDEGIVIDNAVGIARSHEGGNAALEDGAGGGGGHVRSITGFGNLSCPERE